MRSLIFALGGALAAFASAAATVRPLDLPRPEGPRHVLVAAPDRAATGLRPLVILLHGHGGSAAQLLGQQRSAAPLSVWLQIADREGWLLAAPDGWKGADGHPGWNDCRSDAANNPRTDDVGLIVALIDELVARHQADPARVYVMGMSNGGMMTFRAAAALGPRLAAFATVSAAMPADSACAPTRTPLPALIVSGTADPLVPYAGGEVHFMSRVSRGQVLGVEASAAFWRELARLPAEPSRRESQPHRDAADPTRAERIVWGADPAKLQVELLRIDGGGHIEPSLGEQPRRFYTSIVGPQNGDLEIAEEAFAFFKDKRAVPRAAAP